MQEILEPTAHISSIIISKETWRDFLPLRSLVRFCFDALQYVSFITLQYISAGALLYDKQNEHTRIHFGPRSQ